MPFSQSKGRGSLQNIRKRGNTFKDIFAWEKRSVRKLTEENQVCYSRPVFSGEKSHKKHVCASLSRHFSLPISSASFQTVHFMLRAKISQLENNKKESSQKRRKGERVMGRQRGKCVGKEGTHMKSSFQG